MVFCNTALAIHQIGTYLVTILILIDGFLQYDFLQAMQISYEVTILILIDGFLQ